MADEEQHDVPDRLDLSKVIGEKLTESIQNMDLLNTLQKMVATEADDEEGEGIRDKLKGVLQQFKDMGPEDKVKFASKIKEGLASKLSMRLKDNAMLAGVEDAIRSAVMTKLYIFAAVVLLVIFLLGMSLNNTKDLNRVYASLLLVTSNVDK